MFFKKIGSLSGQIRLLALLELICLFTVFYDAQVFVSYFNGISPLINPVSKIQSLMYAITVQLSFLSLGMYAKKSRDSIKGTFTRILTSVAFGVIFLVVTWPFINDQSMATDFIALVPIFSLLLIGGIRVYVINTEWLGSRSRRILFIGAGEKASYIETRMRRSKDRQGFIIHGFIKVNNDKAGIQNENILDIPQHGLVMYVLEHEIDEIVVACDEARNNLHTDELVACRIKGVNVIDICDFVEREINQIPTNFLMPSKLAMTGGFQSNNHVRNTLDWLFNIGIAYILLLITLPIILITALLIKLEDGWSASVFYSQERIGVKGTPFEIFKFRSMRLDAEKHGAQMSGKNDNRITRVGEYIRKFRIDELPQIFNIMRGDMGFVGPRPERPVFVDELAIKYPYFGERHNVKPGLTGWAQLKYPYGSNPNDSFEKLKFDLYYIKHRSFLFDILIMARTVEVVLFGKGR